MKKLFVQSPIFLLLTFLCSFGISAQIPVAERPNRGLYVDKLFKTYVDANSHDQMDINVSLLGTGAFDPATGLYEHEKELLEYCRQNHFTYLVFYDLGALFAHANTLRHPNGDSLQDNLCRLMTKAQSDYCIEYFSAAVSGKTEADSIDNYNNQYIIPPLTLTQSEQSFVPNADQYLFDSLLSPNDPEFILSQDLRTALLIQRYQNANGGCPDFSIITTEYEFWNGTNAPPYSGYITLLNHLDSLGFNAIEAYIQYFRDPTVVPYFEQSKVNELDGTQAIRRRVHRITLTHYATSNAQVTTPFSRADWKETYNALKDSSNLGGTIIHPLFSAESKISDGINNYQGLWLMSPNAWPGTDAYITRNIFTVEKYLYNGWRADTSLHVNISNTLENKVKPGACNWFTQSNMVRFLNNPIIFYRTDHVGCVTSGSQLITFDYCGPIDQNIKYSFTITSFSGDLYHISTGTVTDLEEYPNTPLIPLSKLQHYLDYDPNPYTATMRLTYPASDGSGTCGTYEYSLLVYVNNTRGITVSGNVHNGHVCQDDRVILIANVHPVNNATIQWYRNANAIGTGPSYQLEFLNDAGNQNIYTYTISQDNSCNTSAASPETLSVDKNPRPVITSHCMPDHDDNTLSVSFLESTDPPVSYVWSDNSSSSEFTVPPAVASVYSVVTTQANGCKKSARISIPSLPQLPVIVLHSGNPCSGFILRDTTYGGTAADPFAGNSFNFEWYRFIPDDSTWLDVGSSPAGKCTLSVNIPGIYKVIVSKNTSGLAPGVCRTSASFIAGDILSATVQQPLCGSTNGSITVTATAGSTFLWSNTATTASINNLSPGTYTVSVTHSGCTSTQTFILSGQIHIQSSTVPATCYGGSNGTATATPTSGSSPYTYSWTVGGTTQTASGLSAGSYTCTVTDHNGCTGTVAVAVSQSPNIVSLVNPTSHSVSCLQNNDGAATVEGFGGASPYSYSWNTNPVQNTQTATSLAIGTYVATVTDDEGCTATTSIDIRSPYKCDGNGGEDVCVPTSWTSDLSNKTIAVHADITIDHDMTLNTCILLIDPGIHITISTGITLFLNQSQLMACTDMWGGIINDGGNLQMEYSNILDAEEAVHVSNDGTINLMGSFFNNNYKDLVLLNQAFPAGQNTIEQCTFSCTSGLILKSPYFGEKTYCHIYAEEVPYLLVGNDLGGGNTFENATYAIRCINTNLDVVNCSFNYIDYPFNDTGRDASFGIYASSTHFSRYAALLNNEEEYTLTVDGSNSFNSFVNYKTAIQTSKMHHVNIQYSSFQDCEQAISANNLKLAGITGNYFQDCNSGILCNELWGSGIMDMLPGYYDDITISNNHFNDGLGYNSATYGHDAITVQNYMSHLAPVAIYYNNIENMAIGIHARLADRCNIVGNTYLNQIDQQNILAGKPVYGIWVENSGGTQIAGNEVTLDDDNHNASGWGQFGIAHGISIDQSPMCRIVNNGVSNMGEDIRVYHDCTSSEIRCNEITDGYKGIYFDHAAFTPVGVNQYGNSSDASDNRWFQNYSEWDNTNLQVDGGFANNFPIDWYHQGSSATPDINPYCPYYHGQFVIIPRANATSNGCPYPVLLAPLEPQDINNEFSLVKTFIGNVAGAATDDYGDDETNNYFKDRQTAYEMLMDDFEKIVTDTADSTIENWSAMVKNENIGLLRMAKDYILLDSEDSAYQKLESLTNVNDLTGNQMSAFTYYLDYVLTEDTAISDSVHDALLDLAYSNSGYGGAGVYMARAMLRLDIDDETDQQRKGKRENKQVTEAGFRIYPNPAHSEITVEYDGLPVLLGIFDLQGRRLRSITLPEGQQKYNVNLSGLEPAVYLINIEGENDQKFVDRIAIMK